MQISRGTSGDLLLERLGHGRTQARREKFSDAGHCTQLTSFVTHTMARGFLALRAAIFHDFKSGFSPQQCIGRLIRTFGREAVPTKRTIQRWFQAHRKGRNVLEDLHRNGRRASVITPELVSAVAEFVNLYPHSSYAEIEHQFSISSPQCHLILKQKLGLKKVSSRWVPHSLTEDQKRSRLEFAQKIVSRYGGEDGKRLKEIVTGDEMWAFYYDPLTKRKSMQWMKKGEPRPTKVRRERSTKKTMYLIFFDYSGIVSCSRLIPTQERRTINSTFYVKNCLKKLVAKLRKKRGKIGLRGLKLHHDNASIHKSDLTTAFLAEKKLKILPHPAYSPDLSPCDFFLFPKLKETLRGRRFETEEKLDGAVQGRLRELSKNGFLDVFRSWILRCKKCIEFEGDYFEGR